MIMPGTEAIEVTTAASAVDTGFNHVDVVAGGGLFTGGVTTGPLATSTGATTSTTGGGGESATTATGAVASTVEVSAGTGFEFESGINAGSTPRGAGSSGTVSTSVVPDTVLRCGHVRRRRRRLWAGGLRASARCGERVQRGRHPQHGLAQRGRHLPQWPRGVATATGSEHAGLQSQGTVAGRRRTGRLRGGNVGGAIGVGRGSRAAHAADEQSDREHGGRRRSAQMLRHRALLTLQQSAEKGRDRQFTDDTAEFVPLEYFTS